MKFAIILSLLLVSSGGFAQSICADLFAGSNLTQNFDPKRPWGEQIFARDLNLVQEAFTSTRNLSATEQVDVLLKNDVRRSIFRLQSLSRIYEKMDSKRFSELRDVFKGLEDSIGALELAKSLKKAALRIEEPALVAIFEKQEAAALAVLLKSFKDLGIQKSPEEFFGKLRKSVQKSDDWTNAKDDREYLAETLTSEIKSLHKEIKDNKFDNRDIEKGLHELRRRLRWIVIGVTTLSGTVKFQTEDHLSGPVETWFNEMKTQNPDIMKNKYLTIMDAAVKNPILIPQRMFAMVAELVDSIGKSKDNAEIQIYLTEALEKSGASTAQVARLEHKLEQTYAIPKVDHQALSRQIQERISETDLLKELRKQLETDL
jgi:hypothetical protein